MVSVKLKELMKQADELTPAEKLEFASHLIDQARMTDPAQPPRKWSEIYGSAPYPLVEEDAQAWVSRSRQESEREFSDGQIAR